MTRNILIGLIILLTAIFTVTYITLEAYLIAAGVFVFGAIWLSLHIKNTESLDYIFFMLFIGFAIVASLRDVSIPLMLLGVTINLVVWDLARLKFRIQHIENDEAKSALEVNHLQKLGIVSFAGLVLALVPVFVQFSINFVVFVIILILLMLILRQTVLSLRHEKQA